MRLDPASQARRRPPRAVRDGGSPRSGPPPSRAGAPRDAGSRAVRTPRRRTPTARGHARARARSRRSRAPCRASAPLAPADAPQGASNLNASTRSSSTREEGSRAAESRGTGRGPLRQGGAAGARRTPGGPSWRCSEASRPKGVHQGVRRDGLAAVEQQDREERALAPGGKLHPRPESSQTSNEPRILSSTRPPAAASVPLSPGRFLTGSLPRLSRFWMPHRRVGASDHHGGEQHAEEAEIDFSSFRHHRRRHRVPRRRGRGQHRPDPAARQTGSPRSMHAARRSTRSVAGLGDHAQRRVLGAPGDGWREKRSSPAATR